MKINIISVVLVGFLAFTLALTPAEAARPPLSGVVEYTQATKAPELRIATIGPNVDIFINGFPQNEPEVAINPGDNTKLAAGANDYSLGGIPRAGTYSSADGGATWGNGFISHAGSLSPYRYSGDPVLGFDGANTVYYTGIGFNPGLASDPNAVWVAKSINGGAAYADPVILEASPGGGTFHDKPWIAVDGSNVDVTWTKFQPSGISPIVFKTSTNGGITYGAEVAVSDPGNPFEQGSQVAVGPGGVIYAAWEDFTTSPSRILFDKSTNGGSTFGPDRAVTNVIDIPSPLPNKGFRTNSFPYLAVDKTNGNIYIAWNDYSTGNSDILFTRSTDGGLTWIAPIRVNDNPLGDQFFPAISVDQSNGKINIVFYDTRNDPGNHLMDLYYAESTNGGLSFDPNQRVTTASFNPDYDGFGGAFIGDYIGLASGTENYHPVWADTLPLNADIFTDSLIQQKGGGQIPEFPTVALPVVGVIGMMFLFLRRKHN